MRFRSRWFLPLLAAVHQGQVVRASLIDDIVDAIVDAVDCPACHALLVPLKGVALLGDGAFSSTIIAVCKVLNVVDADVCEGLISQQGPVLAHALRNISPFGQTSTKLCEAVTGLCQAPDVNQWNVPLPPAPANPREWISKGNKPFKVVHFADVHIDREYTPGAEVECTKPICCRRFADQDGSTVQVPAGAIASRNCDTSTALVQSMLHAVEAQQGNFSLFTGDVIEAAVWLVNQTGIVKQLKQFNQEMSTILTTPVYGNFGNHEVAPLNDFPRNTTTKGSVQWVFDTQAAGWQQWVGAAAADSIKHNSGSYTLVVPGTNLRIISINTIYWYTANFWLYDSDTVQYDPNGILAFLAAQLKVAEDAGQRVWIVGHVPPGGRDAMHDQSNYFDQIVNRYKNTIAAQFYGHTHVDEFAISYSDYENRTVENAVNTMWIGPSVVPRSSNPAFKVYEVDPDTYEVMDAKTFMSDLADPSFQTSPEWKQCYSAREVFGSAINWPVTSVLTPAFWHKVTEAFERDDALFKKYLEFKTRGFNVETCAPGECKTAALCALRGGRAENNCHVPSVGLNFRKRELGVRSEGEVYARVDIGMIISQFSHKMIRYLSIIRTAGLDKEAVRARLKAIVPAEVAQ